MGNFSSHEDCEAEKPCTETPACRDVSFLDPRSPTLEIVRTPLEVPPTHRSRLRRLVSLLDPRSPSLHVDRTPLQVPCEDIQPVEEPKLQEAELNAAESVEHALVHLDYEQLPEHIDLKVARALFFGDMSATESPAVSPATNLKPSPTKVKEVEKETEVLAAKNEKALADKEEAKALADKDKTEALPDKDEREALADEDDESQEDKIAPEPVEPIVTTMLPAIATVKCAEFTTTPTLLPRRHNKENALKKQLFHTPDKTRVRTPLSNVSSFHNSPLHR